MSKLSLVAFLCGSFGLGMAVWLGREIGFRRRFGLRWGAEAALQIVVVLVAVGMLGLGVLAWGHVE